MAEKAKESCNVAEPKLRLSKLSANLEQSCHHRLPHAYDYPSETLRSASQFNCCRRHDWQKSARSHAFETLVFPDLYLSEGSPAFFQVPRRSLASRSVPPSFYHRPLEHLYVTTPASSRPSNSGLTKPSFNNSSSSHPSYPAIQHLSLSEGLVTSTTILPDPR